MKANMKRAAEIADRINEIKKALEAQKPLYGELDELIIELSGIAEVNTSFSAGGNFVTLVDNFQSKNTVFRPVGVKRYDVEWLDESEMVKKINKKVTAAGKA